MQLENSATKRPSLIRAVVFTFWREYSTLGLITIMNEIVRIIQPLLLGRLLQFFRKDNETLTKDDAWVAAAGIVAVSLFAAFNSNQFVYQSFITGMRIRVAVCSIIYRKATKLSQNALGDTAPGKVVNLLSNDVNRFDLVSVFIHSMWSAPLFAIVVGYLLYQEVEWAGFVGILAVFLVVPIQCKCLYLEYPENVTHPLSLLSLYWQLVLQVSAAHRPADRRTHPLHGRSNQRHPGDQDVRMGEALLQTDTLGAQTGIERGEEERLRPWPLHDLPVVHYENGPFLHDADNGAHQPGNHSGSHLCRVRVL